MLQSNLESQTKLILNTNQYNSIRRLGKGGFGHVLLATKATSSSTFYAVKCISKRKMIKDPQLKKFLMQEINTMAALDHSNIVKLFKTFQQGDWYFLVMEYCEIGNLYNFQSKVPNKVFNLEEALSIFTQILNGVNFIHKNNIIHRDLKLENIFLKKNQKGNYYTCKIGDFGLARSIGDQETAITNCGTQSYMAPQILLSNNYGKQADVWSLAVLFYYLLVGEFPFKGINILSEIESRCKNGFKLIEHIKNKNLFKNKKEEILLSDLFEKMFQLNSCKRISIKQIMDHAIIKKNTQMINESTTEQDQDESIILWEIQRIQFIQDIVKTIQQYNFLSFYILMSFRFYINKVCLYFLSRQNIRSFKNDQNADPKILTKLLELEKQVSQQFQGQYQILKVSQHLKQNIDRFDDGFNQKVEDFSNFKMAYRNTVGKVYEEAHKRFLDNAYERSSLKLKIFLCHIINRVFTGNVNSQVFPYYLTWAKKKNIKLSQKLYEFKSLNEWIQNQNPQNLQRSQDKINEMFYK